MSAAGLLAVAGLATLTGCEADSWFDPSVVGYWENTPTTMPVLDRIAAIEDKKQDLVESTPPVREDLIAQAQSYRLGPSDDLEIGIRNFDQIGFESRYPRTVDQRGYITLPRIGQIYVLGKTEVEVTQALVKAIEDAELLTNPTVGVVITAPRQQTFSILGGVRTPGTYVVTKPDYRLLDAMSAAGGLDETVEKVYVIRQIPLSESVTGRTAPPPEVPVKREESAPPMKSEDLIDTINKLTQPTPGGDAKPATPDKPSPSSSPAVFRGSAHQPDKQPEKKPEAPSGPKPTQPIDLIDPSEPSKPAPSQPVTPPAANGAATPPPAAKPPEPTSRVKSRWVFINGQWTRDLQAAPKEPPLGVAADPLANQPIGKDLVTQRVIEVSTKLLLAGQSDVNVVIRPGDVVRVPVAETGIVYVGGQVARPGTFALPVNGKLTLMRVVDAAGGWGNLAVPERVDLTRVVGAGREATIRVNARAIAERTQPDFVLKPDDRINVGTNFWAFPIQIIRSGLRMNYGFGFIADRNWGSDLFGVPPESRARGLGQ